MIIIIIIIIIIIMYIYLYIHIIILISRSSSPQASTLNKALNFDRLLEPVWLSQREGRAGGGNW